MRCARSAPRVGRRPSTVLAGRDGGLSERWKRRRPMRDRTAGGSMSALLDGGRTAMDVLGLVGQLAAGDLFAGAGRHQDPGLGIAVGAGRAGAGALAGAAIVLAGLGDAGAFFGVALRGEGETARTGQADGDQRREGVVDEGMG